MTTIEQLIPGWTPGCMLRVKSSGYVFKSVMEPGYSTITCLGSNFDTGSANIAENSNELVLKHPNGVKAKDLEVVRNDTKYVVGSYYKVTQKGGMTYYVIKANSIRERANQTTFTGPFLDGSTGFTKVGNIFTNETWPTSTPSPEEIAKLDACIAAGKYVEPGKESDLILGEYYRIEMDGGKGACYNIRFDGRYDHRPNSVVGPGIDKWNVYTKRATIYGTGPDRTHRLLTKEEREHLDACILADRYVDNKTMFKKDEYIVQLFKYEGCSFSTNKCYKQKEDKGHISAYKCDSGNPQEWIGLKFKDSHLWRYATKEEADRYEREGKPYDTTKPEGKCVVGKYYTITKGDEKRVMLANKIIFGYKETIKGPKLSTNYKTFYQCNETYHDHEWILSDSTPSDIAHLEACIAAGKYVEPPSKTEEFKVGDWVEVINGSIYCFPLGRKFKVAKVGGSVVLDDQGLGVLTQYVRKIPEPKKELIPGKWYKNNWKSLPDFQFLFLERVEKGHSYNTLYYTKSIKYNSLVEGRGTIANTEMENLLTEADISEVEKYLPKKDYVDTMKYGEELKVGDKVVFYRLPTDEDWKPIGKITCEFSLGKELTISDQTDKSYSFNSFVYWYPKGCFKKVTTQRFKAGDHVRVKRLPTDEDWKNARASKAPVTFSVGDILTVEAEYVGVPTIRLKGETWYYPSACFELATPGVKCIRYDVDDPYGSSDGISIYPSYEPKSKGFDEAAYKANPFNQELKVNIKKQKPKKIKLSL